MLRRSMNHKLSGVVLSITPYQESSAMTYLLTKEYGLLRFVLQGFYKPQSKMQALGQPFAQVIYRTNYRENRLLKCFGGDLIHSYNDQRQDYEWLVMMSLMAELIIHNYEHGHYEGMYEDIITNLDHYDPQTFIKMVGRIIEGLGLSPYLKACVVCDDHRINGFSSFLGGFTCQQHTETANTYEELVLLGQLFNHKPLDNQDRDLFQSMIIMLVHYLECHTNIKYHSIELL